MADIDQLIQELGATDPLRQPVRPPLSPDPALAGFHAAAPAILRADRPLFDYSRLQEVPNVPQRDIERYVPPRGVPTETLATAGSKNVKRLNQIAGQGAKIGGLEWYNLEPLRQRFMEELGEQKGNQQFLRYLELISATSPQTKVPENVRNASYYLKALTQGEAIPQRELRETLDPKTGKMRKDWVIKKGTQAPYPYSQTLPLHIQNIENILRAGGIPHMENPKPASFVQNLAGNQRPVTIDTHNMRILGLNRDQPRSNEYGFLERLQQQQAAKLGMTPAQYQASLWLGGAEQTGVKSGYDPALRHIERRIEKTSQDTGKSKEQVLKDLIRGIAPLTLNQDIQQYLTARGLA